VAANIGANPFLRITIDTRETGELHWVHSIPKSLRASVLSAMLADSWRSGRAEILMDVLGLDIKNPLSPDVAPRAERAQNPVAGRTPRTKAAIAKPEVQKAALPAERPSNGEVPAAAAAAAGSEGKSTDTRDPPPPLLVEQRSSSVKGFFGEPA